MSKTKPYLDLCSNCNNAPNCTYIKNTNRPVLQCEEFDSSFVSLKIDDDSNVSQQKIMQTENKKDDIITNNKYKGLCQNCDDRKTCMHRKPETGVWHCEDYI